MTTPNPIPIPATAPLIPPSDPSVPWNGAGNTGASPLVPSVSPNPVASAPSKAPAPPNGAANNAPGAAAAPPPLAPNGGNGANPVDTTGVPSANPGTGDGTVTAPPPDNSPKVASIQDNLDSMLKSGSPYLELAKSQAQQQAASRGLQNSSLAAGSGEAAAIAAAAPIATAQAQLTQQASLQKEAEAAQIDNILTQGTVQEKLQASQQSFEKLINDINNGQQITMANLNFQNQTKLVAQQGGLDLQKINATIKGAIDQINAQAAATASTYGPQLQSQYLTQVSQIMQANQQAVAQIYSTQGLTSAQQQAAVAQATASMQQQIKNLGAFYAASPLWETGQNPAPIPGSRTSNGAVTPSLIPGTTPPGTTPTPVSPPRPTPPSFNPNAGGRR